MLPAYLPGPFPSASGPLGRFLPVVPEGATAAWLNEQLSPGSWLVDPFGTSPRTAAEAARAGYRVLVAANNPISRFLLELHAAPPSEAELRQALADLAISTKSGQRLEAYLRGLYHSECAQCGAALEVQAFVWEREAAGPAAKIYTCPHCKDTGERPASPADADRAARFAAGGMHRARALERVAPLADPDRVHAEEALDMYLPRAVDALFNLVNRLDSFPAARRRLLAALLLSAFDQASSLWPHPPGRARPRQLSPPARFLEKNVWLALEEAVCAWPQALGGAPLTMSAWPEMPPLSGGVCILDARLKDLADSRSAATSPADFQPAGMLAVLPRPNQAYWTLSALWAGWLWGAEASAPFKMVLRRRRYDWAWHTEALQGAFGHLAALLPAAAPCLGLLGEVEPGFLGAALLAASQAGLELNGVALNIGDDQAQLHWRRAGAGITEVAIPATATQRADAARSLAWEHLRRLGEPAAFLPMYAAMFGALVHPAATGNWIGTTPADLLRQAEAAIESALLQPKAFSRYGAGRSLESGLWWLGDSDSGETGRPEDTASEPPLADRLEMNLVHLLQKQPGLRLGEIERRLCARFTGLLTPESELIAACLGSYAEQQPPESGAWQLRPEDAPQARRQDLAEMRRLLSDLGQRLGFRIDGDQPDLTTRTPLRWLAPGGQPRFIYFIIASGVLGGIVLPPLAGSAVSSATNGSTRQIIVLPGGRAGWVEYRLRRDPRLRSAVEKDWLLVKYRHLRRLAGQPDLTAASLTALLPGDPLANRDPQMALL